MFNFVLEVVVFLKLVRLSKSMFVAFIVAGIIGIPVSFFLKDKVGVMSSAGLLVLGFILYLLHYYMEKELASRS